MLLAIKIHGVQKVSDICIFVIWKIIKELSYVLSIWDNKMSAYGD